MWYWHTEQYLQVDKEDHTANVADKHNEVWFIGYWTLVFFWVLTVSSVDVWGHFLVKYLLIVMDFQSIESGHRYKNGIHFERKS